MYCIGKTTRNVWRIKVALRLLPHLYSATTLPSKTHTTTNIDASDLNMYNWLSEKENVFIKPDMWLSDSPDLTPVDYTVWGALQQRVYHERKCNTVQELKRTIFTEWQLITFHWQQRQWVMLLSSVCCEEWPWTLDKSNKQSSLNNGVY